MDFDVNSYIRVPELAKLLGVGRETARKLMQSGEFGPPTKIGRGCYRYHYAITGWQLKKYFECHFNLYLEMEIEK